MRTDGVNKRVAWRYTSYQVPQLHSGGSPSDRANVIHPAPRRLRRLRSEDALGSVQSCSRRKESISSEPVPGCVRASLIGMCHFRTVFSPQRFRHGNARGPSGAPGAFGFWIPFSRGRARVVGVDQHCAHARHSSAFPYRPLRQLITTRWGHNRQAHGKPPRQPDCVRHWQA